MPLNGKTSGLMVIIRIRDAWLYHFSASSDEGGSVQEPLSSANSDPNKPQEFSTFYGLDVAK